MGWAMRIAYAIVAISFCGVPVWAQQHLVPQQGPPTQPVRIEMVCRDMSTTGDFLAPNETMIADKACHPVTVARLGDKAPAGSAQPAAAQPVATAPTAPDIYAAPNLSLMSAPDQSIRVYVTDSASWDAREGWTGVPGTSVAPSAPANSKEAAAVSAEVDKLITEVNRQCPEVVVTSDVTKAVFAVTIAHEGKNRVNERNKVVVFNHGGDDIFSAATRGLGDSIGDACKAILAPAKK